MLKLNSSLFFQCKVIHNLFIIIPLLVDEFYNSLLFKIDNTWIEVTVSEQVSVFLDAEKMKNEKKEAIFLIPFGCQNRFNFLMNIKQIQNGFVTATIKISRSDLKNNKKTSWYLKQNFLYYYYV